MGPPQGVHVMPPPEDYFRGVSPLCRRILEDMSRIREEFGDKWEELTYAEQCRILDQTIVDEATVRKYEKKALPKLDCEYFPKLKISTGQKIVSDEKLSARGYNCSWRDEHSAPFSWHTRSQMDLSSTILPETPMETNSLDNANEIENHDNNNKTKINPSNSFNIQNPTPTTNAFFWHYDPRPETDFECQEPPGLVIASLDHPSQGSPTLISKGTAYNHLIVRGQEESKEHGVLGWIRGALSFLTGTCVPLHSCGSDQKSMLHPGSPFIHPELRPPHVIAKAAKISFPTLNQPKRKRVVSGDSSIFKISRDATLRSECPSANTESTNDIASDRGHTIHSEIGSPKSLNLNSNRNSLLYETCAEEDIFDISEERKLHKPLLEDITNQKNVIELKEIKEVIANMAQKNGDNKREENSQSNDDELPLINLGTNQEAIPKTGFDFLDDW